MSQVTALHGGPVHHTDKQMFLDYVAQMFDEMAADDKAPVCIVFGLVSENGTVKTAYMTGDIVDKCNTLHISRAVMALNCDYRLWDGAV